MLKRILTGLALAALLAFPALAGPGSDMVSLNPHVVVGGPYIHLGDLFTGVKENADAQVAYAPAPGKRQVFETRWLYKVAKAYGVGWRPRMANERTIVTRESNTIYRPQVEEALLVALQDRGWAYNSIAIISDRSFKIHTAIDQDTTLSIEEVSYDDRSNRFVAILAAPANSPSAQRYRVKGRTFKIQEVPVPTRRITKGEVIRNGDIEWKKVRVNRMSQRTLLDPQDIIGMTPRRVLTEGATIEATEVERPMMVKRRSLVTLVLKTPMMTMTSKGRALEDGAVGDTIRVSNTQSNTIIEAIVTGPSMAAVVLASQAPKQIAMN